MRIFNKNSETHASHLAIKKLKKFFDMTKSTINNPVLKRNGVKNSCIRSYINTYEIRLTAMPCRGCIINGSFGDLLIFYRTTMIIFWECE